LLIFVFWNQCLASERFFDAVAQLTGQYHVYSTLHGQRLYPPGGFEAELNDDGCGQTGDPIAIMSEALSVDVELGVLYIMYICKCHMAKAPCFFK
jgi:hypothetical protein